VKPKLYLKFILGPKMGLLHSSSDEPTADVEATVTQVFQALNMAGLRPDRAAMRLRLRRFGEGIPFADGIFGDGCGSFGMLLYAPSTLRRAEIESHLFRHLNLVPFFKVHNGCSADLLYSEPILPDYPELPEPVMVMWPAENSIPVGEHSQSVSLQ